MLKVFHDLSKMSPRKSEGEGGEIDGGTWSRGGRGRRRARNSKPRILGWFLPTSQGSISKPRMSLLDILGLLCEPGLGGHRSSKPRMGLPLPSLKRKPVENHVGGGVGGWGGGGLGKLQRKIFIFILYILFFT